MPCIPTVDSDDFEAFILSSSVFRACVLLDDDADHTSRAQDTVPRRSLALVPGKNKRRVSPPLTDLPQGGARETLQAVRQTRFRRAANR